LTIEGQGAVQVVESFDEEIRMAGLANQFQLQLVAVPLKVKESSGTVDK
jgi:hypothetical protein